MTHKIAPCLWFNGEAEEAAEFYADTARAKRAFEAMMDMKKIDIARLDEAAAQENVDA